MNQINYWTLLGLTLSLLGPLALLIYITKKKIKPFALNSRIILWLLLISIIVIVFFGEKMTLASIGYNSVSFKSIITGIIGAIGILIILPLTQFIFKKNGHLNNEKSYNQSLDYSTKYRVFIVLTAAIVEETLYRGYAIERLSILTGNIWISAIISLFFFTIAHISTWSLRHLLSVFFAGAILTILYVTQRDLIACIIAHTIVDGVGFILIPSVMKYKKRNNKSVPNSRV